MVSLWQQGTNFSSTEKDRFIWEISESDDVSESLSVVAASALKELLDGNSGFF